VTEKTYRNRRLPPHQTLLLTLDVHCLQQLEADYTAQLNSIKDNMSRMKAAHEEAITALETDFSVKLVVEYEKYQTLEAHTKKISTDHERYDCRISCQKDNSRSETFLLHLQYGVSQLR
jgi:hypothetical protein